MKQEAAAPEAATVAQDRAWIPHLRWYICGLLFLAATINYLDRQTLSVLKNDLSRRLQLVEAAYGWINFAFQLAYAVMQGLSGQLVDWLGVRLCFAVAVVVWSLAAMGHAMARGVVGFAKRGSSPVSVKGPAFLLRSRQSPNGSRRKAGPGDRNLQLRHQRRRVIVAPDRGLAGSRHSLAGSLSLPTGVVGFGWLLLWLKFYRSPQEHPRLDRRSSS
jgi:ACS family hexuronate transporter-like MFS transporter